MIIYLVSGDEYEQRYIQVAFVSKHDAEKFVETMNAERKAKFKFDGEFYRLAEEVELVGVPTIT